MLYFGRSFKAKGFTCVGIKIRTPGKFAVIVQKFYQCGCSLYHRVMSTKDADGMANSVDPDQTATLGAV